MRYQILSGDHFQLSGYISLMQKNSLLFTIGAALLAQGGCAAEQPEVTGDEPSGLNETAAAVLPPAECAAQRAVHIVAGSGSLAWFTQVWPVPSVITGFQPSYSFDAPANAKSVGTDANHPLYARRLGARAVWEGLGAAPQPSVFVAGANETHTSAPTSIASYQGVGLAAAGAALQTSLQPVIPAMVFSPAGPYGTATGAPAATPVASVEAAIAALHGKIPVAQEQQLWPSAAQLARYVPAGATTAELTLASRLAFTANAFGLGLVGTVVVPAYNDDPHGAFDTGVATTRANVLATALDAFYADLAVFNEQRCGHLGAALSVANNTVVAIVGDTPKQPFSRAGWADGTPGNSNWMYLRSNGFTRPGWFGQILPSGRTNFNPSTGALDATATAAADSAAAFAGTLYAIARGNQTAVARYTSAPYAGVVQP